MKLKLLLLLFLAFNIALARTTKKKVQVQVQEDESEEDFEDSQEGEDDQQEDTEQEEEEDEDDDDQEDEPVVFSGPGGVTYGNEQQYQDYRNRNRPGQGGPPPPSFVGKPLSSRRPSNDGDSQEDEPVGGGGRPGGPSGGYGGQSGGYGGQSGGYGPPPSSYGGTSGGGPQFVGGSSGGNGMSMGGGPPIFIQGRNALSGLLRNRLLINKRMGAAAGSSEEDDDETLVYNPRKGRVVSFLRPHMGHDYYNPEYVINPSIALERRNYRLRHVAPPIKPRYHFYKSQHGVWGNPREYDIHPWSGHHYYGGSYYGKHW